MDRLPDLYTEPVNLQNEQEYMDSTTSLPILPSDTSSEEDSNPNLVNRRWNRDKMFPKVVREYSVEKLSKSALKKRFHGLIENDNSATSVPCSTPVAFRKSTKSTITPINCSPITKTLNNYKKRVSRSLTDNPVSKNKRNSNIRGNIIMNGGRKNNSLHVNNIDNCNVHSERIQKSIAINTTLKRDSLPRMITRLTRTTATNTSAPINNTSNVMMPPPAKEMNNTCASNAEQSVKNPSMYEASAEESIRVMKDVRTKKLRRKVKATNIETDSDVVVSPSKRNKTVQNEKLNVDNLNIHETPSLITTNAQKSLQMDIVKINLFQNRARLNLDNEEVPTKPLNSTESNNVSIPKEKTSDSSNQILTRSRNKSAVTSVNGITELADLSKTNSNVVHERSRRKVKPKEPTIYILENVTIKPENVSKAKKRRNKKTTELNELDNELEELRKLYKTPHQDIGVGLSADERINSVVDEFIHSMDKNNQVENDDVTASDIPVNRNIRKSKTNKSSTHDDIAEGLSADEPINLVVDKSVNSMDINNHTGNVEESASDIPVNRKIRKSKTNPSQTHNDIDVGRRTDERFNSVVGECINSVNINNHIGNVEETASDIPVKRKRGRPRKHPLPTENGKSVEKIFTKNVPKKKPAKTKEIAAKCTNNVSNKNDTKQNPSETNMPPEANISVNTVQEEVHVQNDAPPVEDTLTIGKRIRKPPKINSMQIMYINQKSPKKTRAKRVTKQKEKTLPKSSTKTKKVKTVKPANSIEDNISKNILNDDELANFSTSSSLNTQGFKVPKGKVIPQTNTTSVKTALSSIIESDAGTTATNILTCDEVNVMGPGDNETITSNLGVSRLGRSKCQYNNTPFTLPGSTQMIDWISNKPEFKKLGNNLSAPTLRTNTLSFGHFKIMPKNKKTTSIAHKSNLSFIILEGEVLVHVYTRQALLGKSTRFYIPAGVEYCLENISEDQTVWLEYTKETCSSVK
ncbi:PREDICTED: uncharacterized protein LOC108561210 [Nicrophorus vespilloides]|uniref:Uncharacterized protein LOC108561210 n=1 Tax=Nicrophorus vespilloides TaxID=110193 RepID=A0ABM1MIZ4_NICVS|nr:PREDICTED: uncharacterized protein LOC108561210 [Nicrophorus vespilloides]